MPKLRLPRRRGRWAATLALLVAAAVVAVLVVSNSGSGNGGSGAGTTATGATTVKRRDLVASDTESGTLSYARPQTVYNRLSGTITWVPQVGRVIRPGQALFMVDNRPVLLMTGSTPAFRNLTAADATGPDVYELNRNLVALGYDPDGIVVDDQWQAATTAGVEELQYHLGETQNGTLTLGQVVFLPGPQLIQTVDTTVGSTAAAYSPSPGASHSLFIDYPADTTTTTTGATTSDTTGTTTAPSAAGTGTGTATTPTGATTAPSTSTTPISKSPGTGSADNLSHRTLQELLRLIRQQQRELRAEQRASRSPGAGGSSPGKSTSGAKSSSSQSPGRSPGSNGGSGSGSSGAGKGSSGGAGNGSSGGAGAVAVMNTSSSKLVVTVDLSASSQSEASVGERVTVEMPDGGTQAGRVTDVSPVAQNSSSDSGNSGAGGGGGSGGSGSSTVPVTITLDRPVHGGGLDQAAVSVNFVQSKASNVLSVPVTALLATSGTSFAVEQANPPHRLIPVRTGLFAAGYVEISGPGIHPGLKVTDSQG